MKKTLVIFAAIVVMLTGCSKGGEEGTITTVTQEATTEVADIANGDLNLDYLEKVAYIEIDDFVKGKYKESIWCKLTDEEVEALKEMAGDIERSETPENISLSYYGLYLYDENGTLITCWDVAHAYCVVDGEGQSMDKDGALKPWLESIEKAHNITYDIYDRTPGDKYFAGLENINQGFGSENANHSAGTENIFFYLDEEDIASLKSLDMEITGQPKEYTYNNQNLYYSVDTFMPSGAEGYSFDVMLDGTVYITTGQLYQVAGEGVEEWFREIEAKYGLDKIY